MIDYSYINTSIFSSHGIQLSIVSSGMPDNNGCTSDTRTTLEDNPRSVPPFMKLSVTKQNHLRNMWKREGRLNMNQVLGNTTPFHAGEGMSPV